MSIVKLHVSFMCPGCKNRSEFTSNVHITEPKELKNYTKSLCPNCLEAIQPKDIEFIGCKPSSLLEGGLY